MTLTITIRHQTRVGTLAQAQGQVRGYVDRGPEQLRTAATVLTDRLNAVVWGHPSSGSHRLPALRLCAAGKVERIMGA